MASPLRVYPLRLKEETISNLRSAAALTGQPATVLARTCIETVFDSLIDDAALLLELKGRIEATQRQEPETAPA